MCANVYREEYLKWLIVNFRDAVPAWKAGRAAAPTEQTPPGALGKA
jgi:hypothetical protein